MANFNMKTILLTSVGNDGAQAVIAALRLSGEAYSLIGVDASSYAYGLNLVDTGYVVPLRSNAVKLVYCLKHIIRKHHVDLVLPLSTEDQIFYAHYADFLTRQTGCVVQHSPEESIRIANNKHSLLLFLRVAGVAVPSFCIVNDRWELESALKDFGIDSNPVVIKRKFSTGASGVKVIIPDQHVCNRIFDRDNIRVPYKDMLFWLAQEQENIFPLQVSEFLPDARYSVDIFMQNGAAIVASVRTEDARFYGASLRGLTISDEPVQALGIKAAESLGLCGTINVEIGRDTHGTPKVMEINPRFPASIDHTVAAGCNMPLWTVQYALGQPRRLCSPRLQVQYFRCWRALCVETGHCK